jgi:hypothetical protein
MTTHINPWTKSQLKIYVLLLCANADQELHEKEIELIKSKVDTNIFEEVLQEFSKDTEDESLEKIASNMQFQDYSNMELAELKREIHEVFFTDGKFQMMEQNLEKILDNIVY